MARKVRTNVIYVVVSLVFCASIYHHYLREAIFSDQLPPSAAIVSTSAPPTATAYSNFSIHENLIATPIEPAFPPHAPPLITPSPSYSPVPHSISTTSILLPDWEILVVVSLENSPLAGDFDGYFCLFDNNEVSSAKFAGVLHFPDRLTFSCLLPASARRRLPFKQPQLFKSQDDPPKRDSLAPSLLLWSYLAYDSLTTDDDVVLFVKGVNTRQGINRSPKELRCVFGNDVTNSVKTAVKTSMQEVFRCQRPVLMAVASVGGEADPIKVSLEIVAQNRVVPSVTYYTPPRKLDRRNGKSLLCATTMVYNVGKFLREWVLYHSKIGVEKFLLYDNGSDDNLEKVVEELIQEGFDVRTYYWLWPKTQESGFSHGAIYAKDACTWMMYIDVDEFIYSPSWEKFPQPSKSMLHLLISRNRSDMGQFSISCYEFGPSDQETHPVKGVTQGYNCRKRKENRHKSIVLLDAIDDSLHNVIHHFSMHSGHKSKKLNTNNTVVNHYKYQAWPEFKAKFRRRVSAYVLDWTQKLNPKSNDRTPGLGFVPVEPNGWPQMFCEVRDNKLKDLTWKWFAKKRSSGYEMAWQR